MRYLFWILKFILFVLALSFAMKNTETVTVRYYPDSEWQAPLILVLLVFFCAGAALGMIAGLARMFRQRREIAALRAELRQIPPGGTGGAEKTVSSVGAGL